MSDPSEPSLGALDLERAVAAGELAARRAGLHDAALGDSERAALYCRLGENLYYRDERQDAADCARAAFALAPQQEAVADFCAWLFSNCGCHDEAAAAYRRLLDRRPGWAAGHRHLSGSLAAAGDVERAIQHAAAACEIEPAAPEFAIHAGGLLASIGLNHDAVEYFSRARSLAPGDPGILRHLSSVTLAQGEPERALVLARQAQALAPGEREGVHHLTEVLLRCARFAEAAATISAALDEDDCDDVGYRLLSAAEMLRGQCDAALAAIDRAAALAPAAAEYHLHRGNLLYRMARFEEAAAAFERAAALDPDNSAAKRLQLSVYIDGGRVREAVAVGGQLIHIDPDNEEYAQAVVHVLNRRLDILDGDWVVLGDRQPPTARAAPAKPAWWSAWQTQWRVIHALIIRETRTRFGDSTLGYGWALLEPVLHILMLSLVFAVLMHGRPPIGTQFFIFYYTGIIPYHVFVHTSSSMTYAVAANGGLLQLPLVDTFDVILARGLLELATDIIVAAILLAGFGAVGLGTLPHDFGSVAASVAVVWLLACGFGFINAVINAFFKSWDKIWAQLTRILYFCSGIFYVPGMMPDWIRDMLAWNPVLQAVDWFRASFFADYQPHWLDRAYLAAAAALVLLAGLALERSLRRRLYEPQ